MAEQPRVEVAGIEASVDSSLAEAVWDRDASVWGAGEDDPAERLGWLELPHTMQGELTRLRAFARAVVDDGIETVVLLGMGGSSLAPEVFFETFGAAPGYPDLWVLDSTHPAQIARVRDAIDLQRTLWLVSSKSGSTVETMSLYRYFRDLRDDGSAFVAITDPGTSLAELAGAEGFRDLFLNPPDIGGRYSALSFFGLVPAALVGADLGALLASAAREAEACSARAPADANPGLVIGSAMARAALAGRDKLTFVTSSAVASLGDWIEQLIAESTGKHDKGIVPVVGEPVVDPSRYGADRVFAWIRFAEDDNDASFIRALSEAGHPVITTHVDDLAGLGGEMFRWEFATAVAGAVLGINAFDQPNVEAAKRAGREVLEGGEEIGWESGDPGAFFAALQPGELAAIAAFAPRTEANDEVLAVARRRLVEGFGVATMRGFGPRYLHSTGQLQKGGPPRIRALVTLDEPAEDVAIPGSEHGFARLVAAQAVGDVRALEGAGRPVAQARWDDLVAWSQA